MSRTARIVLASASPRRRELLAQIGLSFDVMPARGEEQIGGRTPADAVRFLSRQKAEEVAARIAGGEGAEHGFAGADHLLVIGADTVVSLEGRILGKPRDRADAKRMLQSLSGRTHEVWTGVTLIALSAAGADAGPGGARRPIGGSGAAWQRETTFAERTEVDIEALSDGEIEAYLASGEADDKAGAYGIQGGFAVHVSAVRGDFYNVVGLPLAALHRALRTFRATTGNVIDNIREAAMHDYDDAVLQCFLRQQGQLFSERVAETPEEAEEFLADCMAVVLDSPAEVEAYFEEEGMDVGEGSALDADEVFEIGDGRYLVVEG